jgi:MOSC domain-containing protein YiiM
MTGRVVSVNVGVESTGDWTGPRGRTGIDKRPVAHRVAVSLTGLAADCVVRGDQDQAVYAFAAKAVVGTGAGWRCRPGGSARICPQWTST